MNSLQSKNKKDDVVIEEIVNTFKNMLVNRKIVDVEKSLLRMWEKLNITNKSKLVKIKIDIDKIKGYTIFLLCCLIGFYELAQTLYTEYPTLINNKDDNNNTPLMIVLNHSIILKSIGIHKFIERYPKYDNLFVFIIKTGNANVNAFNKQNKTANSMVDTYVKGIPGDTQKNNMKIIIELSGTEGIDINTNMLYDMNLDVTISRMLQRNDEQQNNFHGNVGTQDDEGVAFEIHNKSNELLSDTNFINIILNATYNNNNDYTQYNNIPSTKKKFEFLFDKIFNYIKHNPNTFKEDFIHKLELVKTKITFCNINVEPRIMDFCYKSVNFALEFKKGKPLFTQAYITIFHDETTKAYKGDTGSGTISCVKGIVERFYTSLLSASAQVSEIYKYDKDIQKLKCIYVMHNEIEVNSYMQKWASEWRERASKWETEEQNEWRKLTPEQRKKDLVEFIRSQNLSNYEQSNCNSLIQLDVEMVNNKIIKTLPRDLDYVFNNKENVAEFGGKVRHNKIMNRTKNVCKVYSKTRISGKRKNKRFTRKHCKK